MSFVVSLGALVLLHLAVSDRGTAVLAGTAKSVGAVDRAAAAFVRFVDPTVPLFKKALPSGSSSTSSGAASTTKPTVVPVPTAASAPLPTPSPSSQI